MTRNASIKYLLGIDAGGTKTDFMLTDLNMNIIKSFSFQSANPVDIGIDAAKRVLCEGITACCADISLNEISCFAGIAGGITGNNKEELHSFLSTFGFAYFDNGSDIENCIAETLGTQDGAVVIMGTGIVAFYQKNKDLHRIGGWGYLLDKGGSGYHIGADALNCALGCYDNRGGSVLLKEMIVNKLQAKIPDCIQKIHHKGKSLIASFAPLVFDAYKRKDLYAEKIIARNVQEVAILIQTAFTIAGNNMIPVYICGGLCNEKEILQPFFMDALPCCNIHFSSTKPVIGALKKAYSLLQNGE